MDDENPDHSSKPPHALRPINSTVHAILSESDIILTPRNAVDLLGPGAAAGSSVPQDENPHQSSTPPSHSARPINSTLYSILSDSDIAPTPRNVADLLEHIVAAAAGSSQRPEHHYYQEMSTQADLESVPNSAFNMAMILTTGDLTAVTEGQGSRIRTTSVQTERPGRAMRGVMSTIDEEDRILLLSPHSFHSTTQTEAETGSFRLLHIHPLYQGSSDEFALESDYPEFGGLHVEELSKIFTYLSAEERQRFRGVCRTWRIVVDKIFGMKIRIKNCTSDLVTTCPNAVEVELYSMTHAFFRGAISFANSVRKLVFSNIVVTYNLISFLRACGSKVSYLAFHNVILDLPISDPWARAQHGSLLTNGLHEEEFTSPIRLDMEELETLEIKCFTFTEGIMEVLTFLTEYVSYRKLKNVVCNVQNPPVIPFQFLFQRNFLSNPNAETVHPLVRLLFRLRPSLRKFVIGRPTMPTVLQFHEEFSPDPADIPRLEVLEIHPYFREEWSSILREQADMRVLNLGSCNISRWPDIQDAIILNALSLEAFTIGGLSFGQIWDCSVFQSCLQLRSISIEISHSNKVNLAMIPLNVKNFHIFGPVPKHEITAVAENLVGLETLKFTHLGRITEFNNAEEDRVDLELFKALLQLPNLKSLTFATCSTISIDWDMISLWCAGADGTPGFNYAEKFFQTHGEFFRNGISVELGDEFKRDEFDWDSVPAIEVAVDSSTVFSQAASEDESRVTLPHREVSEEEF